MKFRNLTISLVSLLFLLTVGCLETSPERVIVSDSGVKKTSVVVQTNAKGITNEQENVGTRLQEDAKIGAVKHLYVISPYSGDCILYCTVIGKVTSSGKRLTNPLELVRGDRGEWNGDFVMPAIQDDGTFGSSCPYIYWWDARGVYHQHFFTGGQIIHVSSEPVAFPKIMMNLEITSLN